MTAHDFYDELEVRDPAQREEMLFNGLVTQLKEAQKHAPYFKTLIGSIDVSLIKDRAALATIPITRKSDLVNLQAKGNPLGGLTTVSTGQLKRIFQSPGPTYDAEGSGEDWWGTARALYASGVRKGDILHNTFSYHFTPAGVMLEQGAEALGCAVFPAGVGNTDLQVQAIHDIESSAYTGTPSFLKIILEKAAEQDKDISSLKKACVGGEGLPPPLRDEIEAYGIHCGQVYASAEA